MNRSNRLLVRDINSGELAAIKIPPPLLAISKLDVGIPTEQVILNVGANANAVQLQFYDDYGNGILANYTITSTAIIVQFSAAFTGSIHILYKPDHFPRITSIVPEIKSAENYYGQVYALGGVPPYFFSIVKGTLPAGIELNGETGEIRGISYFAQTEQINITCKVSDFYGNSTESELTISLIGSEIYGRITKAGNLRITKSGNIRITKAQ